MWNRAEGRVDMPHVVEFIKQSDTCSLLFLALLLLLIGQQMVARRPKLKRLGMRIAVAVLLLYVVGTFLASRPATADDLLPIVLHGVVLSALALGAGWILLPVLSVLAPIARVPYIVVSWPVTQMRGIIEHCRHAWAARRERVLQESRQSQRAADAEEHRRDAEKRLRKETAERKRRDDARLECQLLYDRHAAELTDRFPPDRLQHYFTNYLSNDCPPTLVKKRANLLMEMITQAVGGNSGRPEFESLSQIAEYFHAQREQIDQLDYDSETKQSFLVAITLQEEEAIRRFLAP